MILPQQQLFLLVALLLACWLWLLVRRRESQHTPRTRPAPMSPAELGRTLFVAARSQDLAVYRDTFLNGQEADIVLGNRAAEYLDGRSYAFLQERLQDLQGQLPAGGTFDGAEIFQNGRLSIRLKLPDGVRVHIRVGTAVQIGSLWRLVAPQPRIKDIELDAIEPISAAL